MLMHSLALYHASIFFLELRDREHAGWYSGIGNAALGRLRVEGAGPSFRPPQLLPSLHRVRCRARWLQYRLCGAGGGRPQEQESWIPAS